MVRIFQFIHWLSLDVVAGCLVLLSFYGRQYGVDLPVSVYFALGSTVWLIYSIDHLIDTKNLVEPSLKRHQLFRSYRKSLIAFVIIVSLTALGNLIFLPPHIIIPGFSIAALCLFYLLYNGVLGRIGLKEIVIAILFGIAVMIYPIVSTPVLTMVDLLLIIQLIFLAYLNLVLISLIESENDRMDNFDSIIQKLSLVKAKRLWFLVFSILIISSTGMILYGHFIPVQLFLLMSSTVLIILLLLRTNGYKGPYHFIADSIFFIPLIL